MNTSTFLQLVQKKQSNIFLLFAFVIFFSAGSFAQADIKLDKSTSVLLDKVDNTMVIANAVTNEGSTASTYEGILYGLDELAAIDQTDSDFTAEKVKETEDDLEVMVDQTFDLALTKMTSAGSYSPGDEVAFDFVIYNQGAVNAFNVQVTDYLPLGFNFDPLNAVNQANNWAMFLGYPTAVIPGPIAPNTSVNLQLIVQIDPSFTLTFAVNKAEISGFDDDMDAANLGPVDIDSTPDFNEMNDAGGFADTPSDDVINGDGTGNPNDTNPDTDEDDADPALVVINQVYDLAITKDVISTGPYMVGDQVIYEISVSNEGVLDASNIVVTDQLPAGLNFISGTDFTSVAPYTSSIASLPAGSAPVVLTVVTEIDTNFTGNSITNIAEITVDDGMDVDSTPDNNDLAEDDQDDATISVGNDVFDLALRKTRLSTENLVPGGDIVFEITVFNQGNVEASNIEIFDYIPAGFSLSPNDMNSWFLSGTNGYNTIAGPIAPNSFASIEIVLRADVNVTSGTYANRAEIIGSEDIDGNDTTSSDVDSNADTDEANDLEVNDEINDNGAFDEDDADVEQFDVKVFDLALQKLNGGTNQVLVGDDITFTIIVYNQGTIDATNIEIADFIPSGFILSSNNSGMWNMSGGAANTVIPSLLAGEQIAIDLVLNANTATAGSYENIAEILTAQDNMGVFIADLDSTPDSDPTNDNFVNDEIADNGLLDEDDNDREVFVVNDVPVYDMALRKTVLGTAIGVPNDDITFLIEVFNQGNSPVSNVSIVDYLPPGLSLSLNDSNSWNTIGGNIFNNIAGPIAAGSSTIVELVTTINSGQPAGIVTNIAEINDFEDGNGTSVAGLEVDSQTDIDPGNDVIQDDQIFDNGTFDEDDHDIAVIEVSLEIVDIALIKRISPMQSQPLAIGDNILFEIEIINQGTVDLSNIQVVDYLPEGMTLSAADTNNWNPLTSSTLSNIYPGPLAAGSAAIIELLVTTDNTVDSLGVTNMAEIADFTDDMAMSLVADDIDSFADSDPTNDGNIEDDNILNTNGDEDDSDIAHIIFNICEDVVVSNNASICLGDTVQLTATLNQSGVTYIWSPSEGLSCTDCANPMASPNTSINYTVTATYGACSSSDIISVAVVPELSIIETITDVSCCGTGAISLNVTGGSGTYIASWSNVALTGLDVSSLASGTYAVTITDDISSCSLSASYDVIDDCNCMDIVVEEVVVIPVNEPTEICLPFTFQESQSIYEVLLSGTGVLQPVDSCNIDSVYNYAYFSVEGQGNAGPYMLDFWYCGNGQTYSGVIFQNIDELVDSMNVWDPQGNWTNVPMDLTITGGFSHSGYGDIEITHIASGITSFLNSNGIAVAQGQIFDVPDTPGAYEYIVTNTTDCCIDSLLVIVEEPTPITPDFTSYFTEVNNPIFLCVNTSELSTTPISLDFCEDPINGQVIFDTGNECMTYIPAPNFIGLDSFCVIVCDEAGVCDTTYVDVAIEDEPHGLLDTITYTTQQNMSTGIQCMPWQKFFSTGFDTLIVCGQPMYGTLISDGDNECIEYIPDMNFCGQDSMCITTCSDMGVCGTITIYINVECGVPMPDLDTVFISVLVNTILEDACVPLDELNGVFDTLFLCGEAANGSVAVNDFDHCVDYTPDLNYTGSDEFCIVVCDFNMICDTTYFIVDVTGTQCDTIFSEMISLEADMCGTDAVLCTPFDVNEILDYIVTVGGDQYADGFVGCEYDTMFSYNYFTIPDQGGAGPYNLDQWIIDGQAFNGSFIDIPDLVNLMNSFDTSSTWTLDATNYRIQGGNPNTDYGNIFISQPSTMGTATLQLNTPLTPTKVGIKLPTGVHDVRLSHTSGCPIYQYDATVTCTPILIDTISYAFEVGDSLIICSVDLGVQSPITQIINSCPTSSGSEAAVNIDVATGCIEMIGLQIGDSEKVCLEICTIDTCSQFVFLMEVLPICDDIFIQDSIVLMTNDCSSETEVCLSIPFANISAYTIEIDGASYTGPALSCSNGTALSLMSGEHMLSVRDTSNNCIDSLLVNIACITPDTIYDSIRTMNKDSICIDLSELNGAPVSIDNLCPNSSGEVVVFDINQNTNCVSYTGIEPGVDTACIVVCDNMNLCDTTIIIVDVAGDFGAPPIAVSDSVTTFLNTEFEINISLNDSIPGGIDTLYVLNFPTNGIVVLSENNMLTYTPDDGYCNPETPDDFSYIVCNEFGCDTATVEVYVLCDDIVFFSGFSPNGDGINDAFIVQGIQNYPDHELAIYNRWGNQVLLSKDYENDWQGVWEGLPLPDGTYFYVFEDGNGKIYSGYVQIHR